MAQTYERLNDIGILHRSNEATVPRWRQDDVYKLILGFKGPIVYETPRSKFNVRAGQFLLLNPGDKHQQVRCDGDKFLVEFSPKLVNAVTREVMDKSAVDLRLRPMPACHGDVAKMADMLVSELIDPRPGQKVMLEHMALQLLVLALRSTLLAASDVAVCINRPGVKQAVDMMIECYRDVVTLEDIARAADMSKFSLIRQFREVMGDTPYQWLQQYRLRRACDELTNVRRRVLDVALDHGFNSVSAFNREFLRTFGMSPTQWRQLHR